MRVLLDGQPHPLLNATPTGVASILAEIDAVLEHRGRGIQQIIVNGEAWTLERVEDELPSLNVADVDTLDVRTESMRVLVERSLVEVQEVIDELPAACHSLAALLNSSDRDAALDEFEAFAAIWEELFDRHGAALHALKISAKMVSVQDVPLDKWQLEASTAIERGRTLADQRDAVSLADFITYDLLRFAEEEARVLDQLLLLVRNDDST